MNKDITRDIMEKMLCVANRAHDMNILHADRLTLLMDLEVAHRYFDGEFDIDALIAFDDFSFAHDVIGIQNRIDRASFAYVDDHFVPRCCREKVTG